MDYNFNNPYQFLWAMYMPNGYATTNPSAAFNAPQPLVGAHPHPSAPPGFPLMFAGQRFPSGVFPFGVSDSFNNSNQSSQFGVNWNNFAGYNNQEFNQGQTQLNTMNNAASSGANGNSVNATLNSLPANSSECQPGVSVKTLKDEKK